MISFKRFSEQTIRSLTVGADKPNIISVELPVGPSSSLPSDPIIPLGVEANIKGRVTKTLNRGYFAVVTPAQGKRFELFYSGFLPVKQGDAIQAKIRFLGQCDKNGNKAEIIDIPSVQTPCDRDSLIQIFITMFRRHKFGGNHAAMLFDAIEKVWLERKAAYPDIYAKIDNVTRYLTYLSDTYSYYRDFKILNPISEILNHLLTIDDLRTRWNPPKSKLQTGPVHISMTKFMMMWWKNCHDIRQLYLLELTRFEIMETQKPLQELYDQLLHNPYSVPTIPLEKCRRIDRRIKREPHSLDEKCGLLIRALYQNMKGKAWTCTPRSWIQRRFPDIDTLQDHLIKDFEIIFTENSVYSKMDAVEPTHKAQFAYFKVALDQENYVADWLIQKIKSPPQCELGEPVFDEDSILDETQKEFIHTAFKNNISICTGPAGSGKTTAIKDLAKNLLLQQISFNSTSFTGKACSRIRQVTAVDAQTMHRMIATADNISKFDFLIVDEASMIDVGLMAQFLSVFTHPFHMILIGDPNQLPPIKYGSFFKATIESHSVPMVRLTSIHRVVTKEGKTDGIITNTTRITKWPVGTSFAFEPADNFKIKECKISQYSEFYQECQRDGLDVTQFITISPYKDIIPKFNTLCQLIFNGNNPKVIVPDHRVFYIGDKVMMMENDYDRNIMNGDEGMVVDVHPDHIIVKWFDGKVTKVRISSNTNPRKRLKLDYGDNEIMDVDPDSDYQNDAYKDDIPDINTDQIQHSFAITCHKSQGGQWKRVYWYLGAGKKGGHNFLHRNLIYTGLTRAEEEVIVTGNIDSTCEAIANDLPWRCEGMADKLRDGLPRLHQEIIEDPFAGYEAVGDEDDYCYDDEWAPD